MPDGRLVRRRFRARQTVEAAAAGGVREVVVDVNVGLPRCGCEPGDAGRLADLARAKDSGEPAVRLRGLERHVTAHDGPGAIALIRAAEDDLFR